MNELNEQRKRARHAREELAKTEELLKRRNNLLRRKQRQLSRLLRQGQAETKEYHGLLAEIEQLKKDLQPNSAPAPLQTQTAAGIQEAAGPVLEPWELIQQLSDDLPFLLAPIRIETRFMTVEDRHELWVRFFPDDIAVHTHEDDLTEDEIESGKSFWRQEWTAKHTENADLEKGAWRVLVGAYGGARASWIKLVTRPTNFAEAASTDDLKFPDFPEESIKPESWSIAPRSNIMPDRFVVMGFVGGGEVFRVAANPIPDPLIVGPDPGKDAEQQLRQDGGELQTDETIAWLYDFQKAVNIGMGVRIPLEPNLAESGLDQLFVLGLRLNDDEHEIQARVEALIENHTYAPDGFGFVPQGTPTNNTERYSSGYSSSDPGAEASFALEFAPDLSPVDDPLQKLDGQRLVEALGIGYQPISDGQQNQGLGIGRTALHRIAHADQSDVRDAMMMNRALWSGTLGYYLEQMLELKTETIETIRTFFESYVTGRGPLPAIRTGPQPYGVLLTSDFSHWKSSPDLDGAVLPTLDNLYGFLLTLQKTMAQQVGNVWRIGAAEGADPFENLLMALGLQPTSVEFYRRHATGLDYLWNYIAFRDLSLSSQSKMMQQVTRLANSLAQKIHISGDNLPRLFHMSFFDAQDPIKDPLVDDIPETETENLSETNKLRSLYLDPRVVDGQNVDPLPTVNYVEWLAYSPYTTLRNQFFISGSGELQPPPRPLLYRMLRVSLLQALLDAAIFLYRKAKTGPFSAPPDPFEDPEERLRKVRQEVEFINIQGKADPLRLMTRWELLDQDISKVVPNKTGGTTVADFLLSEEGLLLPQSANLRKTVESIRALGSLSTAQLERAFAEHIDLCSYRLDGWQTGYFYHRLQQLRFPAESPDVFEKRKMGLYLGAFGWVENLCPAGAMTPADLTSVPVSLHDPQKDGTLFEQPRNAGFIHGPSLNHAATAAILRSTYLTHFDPDHPETMAVNLSSKRVRIALDFLDGVRSGESLGALLGYEFERGLSDNYSDLALHEYIKSFRQRYPVLADKITPSADPAENDSQPKEARNVFDGYALLEAVLYREPPLEYPYDIPDLPEKNSSKAKAIECEVAGMIERLDAIADLALAEGVYQVGQGNFDRAGSMLKSMSQGEMPPEPEIARTPRHGLTINQRVVIHLPTAPNSSDWPGPATPRAVLEPNLNAWLADLLPNPTHIVYTVSFPGKPAVQQNILNLQLKPIDLIYLIGQDLNGETTELESRIIFVNRRVQGDAHLDVRIDFMTESAEPGSVTFFELLPLLRRLRRLITSSRPLQADDFELPSEITRNAETDTHGVMLSSLKSRVQAAINSFREAVTALGTAIPPNGTDGQPDPKRASSPTVRTALRKLADFGIPDAFPLSAFSDSLEAKTSLTRQAISIYASASAILGAASKAADNAGLATGEQSLALYRTAVQTIFGGSFNLIPAFKLKNPAELTAARNFRDADPAHSLTRYYEDNLVLVDEWMEGEGRVRPNLNDLQAIDVLSQAFGQSGLQYKPLQLPFRAEDHWIVMEYPEGFKPVGEFLSIVQVLPSSGFHPEQSQSGLMIDVWGETNPEESEVTGIAFHYNQPSTDPPQVCLLAVTPEIAGNWSWEKLMGILQDTFARAKQRAVEPDQLGDTAYGHLLPAIITPIASRPFATITADLVHETSVRFKD